MDFYTIVLLKEKLKTKIKQKKEKKLKITKFPH